MDHIILCLSIMVGFACLALMCMAFVTAGIAFVLALYKHPLLRGVCAGLVLLFAMSHPSYAQTTNITRVPGIRSFGAVEVTPAQTLSATTVVLVTGSQLSNSLANDPGQVRFQGSSVYVPETLHAWWSVDVSKATAGGGTCALYLNGTIVTRTSRTYTPAAWTSRGTIGGQVALIGATDQFVTGGVPNQAQTLDIRCNSSDTNAFTINAASLYAEEHF